MEASDSSFHMHAYQLMSTRSDVASLICKIQLADKQPSNEMVRPLAVQPGPGNVSNRPRNVTAQDLRALPCSVCRLPAWCR
jgi:hypothetical protein